MRHVLNIIATLVFVSLLFSCAAEQSGSVGSEGGISSSGKSDVKVSIAIVEGGHQTTASPLHIVIENISAKPQGYFDEWNSWGYHDLTLEWIDSDGHSGIVTKTGGQMWTRNFPSTTVLQSGEALVREISFDPKDWKGWPDITHWMTLKLKVTYHAMDVPETSDLRNDYKPGWIGSVTSKEQTVQIGPPLEP